MKRIILISTILMSASVYAQTPEDALRYSYITQNGTARILATGGAVTSLGGDITSTFVNPAGLGFFKTNEFVFSPGFNLMKDKASFRNTVTNTQNNRFQMGPVGIIIGQPETKYNKNSSAFSLAFSQQASFNSTKTFNGLNNLSSFSEQFAEEFARSGYTIDGVLNTQSLLPYTAAPALNTFLIDTVRINGQVQVRGAAEGILDGGEAIRQQYESISSGGIYELAIGGAINDNDKWLLGGSIGLPFIHYKNNTTLSEADTSAKTTNGFKSASFRDEFTTSGIGINLRLGAIYRPVSYVRLGLAIHSPNFYSLTDRRETFVNTALETPSGAAEQFSDGSDRYDEGTNGRIEYTQRSPWRVMGSASYVFREIENTKKQRGFITADVEYLNYGSAGFGSNAETPTSEERAYYKSLKKVIKDEYKGTINAKIGAELKFNTIMIRQGVAYYGNPYEDDSFKSNRFLYSGGLGYRNKGFFIDLTYILRTAKDVIVPYRLADRENTFANVNTKGLGFAATVGVKF